MSRFKDIVDEAWNGHFNHIESCQLLFNKLKKTGLCLRQWRKSLFSKAKLDILALESILRLDVAQERRALSIEERDITQRLKRRIIGLAALERTRKRQASIITNLKEGDANTRFFHLRVNAKKPHSLF
jgi:hypothetical protein